MKLVIGNKAYSSWSLRSWILLKSAGIEFEEIKIVLNQPQTKQKILSYSPSGKVPALIDGDLVVWDTYAIAEYLHEKYPKKDLWPTNLAHRALARSICAEMHAGLFSLRRELPTNFRFQKKGVVPSEKAAADIQRIFDWITLAKKTSSAEKFLFGSFGIVDAFFSPLANRLHNYFVPMPAEVQSYINALLQNEFYQEWCQDAAKETDYIEHEEVGVRL